MEWEALEQPVVVVAKFWNNGRTRIFKWRPASSFPSLFGFSAVLARGVIIWTANFFHDDVMFLKNLHALRFVVRKASALA